MATHLRLQALAPGMPVLGGVPTAAALGSPRAFLCHQIPQETLQRLAKKKLALLLVVVDEAQDPLGQGLHNGRTVTTAALSMKPHADTHRQSLTLGACI